MSMGPFMEMHRGGGVWWDAGGRELGDRGTASPDPASGRPRLTRLPSLQSVQLTQKPLPLSLPGAAPHSPGIYSES